MKFLAVLILGVMQICTAQTAGEINGVIKIDKIYQHYTWEDFFEVRFVDENGNVISNDCSGTYFRIQSDFTGTLNRMLSLALTAQTTGKSIEVYKNANTCSSSRQYISWIRLKNN